MNPTILVIEDNVDNLTLIAWTLEDAGYEYCGVESAEEAFDLLEQRSFDLVLMDISLPNMNGKEATRRLRANPRYASLPIIAVTAHAIPAEEQAIRASGVNEILIKPIEKNNLLETIKTFLNAGVKNDQNTRR